MFASTPKRKLSHSKLSARQAVDRDSVFNQTFKPTIFVTQFLYHVFFPFSLPFFCYFEGRVAAINQGFLGCNVRMLVMSWLPAFSMFAVTVWATLGPRYYNMSPAHLTLFANLSGTSLVVYVMRAMTIAVKYSFMSPALHALRRQAVCPKEMRDETLVGWSDPDKDVIIQEVELAAYRCAVDLSPNKLFFEYRPGSEEESMLRELIFAKGHAGDPSAQDSEHQEQMRRLTVPERLHDHVHDFHTENELEMEALMHSGRLAGKLFIHSQVAMAFKASEKPARRLFSASAVIGLMLCFAPIVARFVNGTLPLLVGSNRNLWTAAGMPYPYMDRDLPFFPPIASTLVWFIVFWYCMWLLFAYLLVGVLDFARRATILKNVTNSISERVQAPHITMRALGKAVWDNDTAQQDAEVWVGQGVCVEKGVCMGKAGREGVALANNLAGVEENGPFANDENGPANEDDDDNRAANEDDNDTIAWKQNQACKYQCPEVTVLPPPLPLGQFEGNILTWYRCRLILLNVGGRYQHRVQTIASVGLVGLFFLVVYLLLDSLNYFNEHNIDIGYITLVVGFAVVLIMALLNIVLSARQSNKQLQVCREYLYTYKCQVLLSTAGPQGKARDALLEMFDTVDHMLCCDDKLHPITVFGVRADNNLLRGVATLCVSAGSLIIRMVGTNLNLF